MSAFSFLPHVSHKQASSSSINNLVHLPLIREGIVHFHSLKTVKVTVVDSHVVVAQDESVSPSRIATVKPLLKSYTSQTLCRKQQQVTASM